MGLLNWLGFGRRTLLVMRLDDMIMVHPQMDTSHVCSMCGEQVGIYPSGQAILKQYRRVKICCDRCQPLPSKFMLAPGAREESGQSRRR